MATEPKQIEIGGDYKEKYGFFVPEDYIFKAKRGLNPEIVKEISWMKKEPEWMTKLRLRSLEIFRKKPMPTWGADLSVIDFVNSVTSPGSESLIAPLPSRSAFSLVHPSVIGTTKSTTFPDRASLKLTGVPSSVTPR